MKQKLLFLLTALCFGFVSGVKADVVVPTPVYFNDFSFATSGEDDIEIVGNGQFEDDADERFGRIFHNDPNNTSAIRTNYLKLPTNILSHSSTSKELTIGFWVNKKSEDDFWFMPLFTAYGAAPAGSGNTWPMFACQTRGLLQVNCAGYCDFTNGDNDKKTNYEGTYWLDDGNWHYYSAVLTETTAKVYVDGAIVNSWTVDGSDGHNISGLFTSGSTLTYVCLGGNQAWDWANADPAFGFDDFVVYNVALSKDQIDQIRYNKLNRSATGTRVGKQDNSTEYVTATSEKVTLKPGESYHYSFINYNNGSTNHNNWILPVYNTSDARVISVRADNWEDMHHVGQVWGSSAGCTSDFNWTNFPGNINGANVDMTITFTKDKVFNMSSTINTVDGSTWHYSYTNDYTDSPITLTSNDYIKVALSVSRSWLDITSQGYSAVSATIGSTGWTTFASPYALNLNSMSASEGTVKAYYASSQSGSNIVMTSTDQTVAAGTGLMLKGTAGATVTIPVAASGTGIGGNMLVGCTTLTEGVSGSDKYVLVNNGGKAEFQNLGTHSANIPAGKAYLNTGVSTARLIISIDDEDPTAINAIEAVESNDGALKDGKYLIDGKIVLVKNGVKYGANGQKLN